MLPHGTRHRTCTRVCLLALLCCAAAAVSESSDSDLAADVPANLTIVFGLSQDGLAYRILQAILPYLEERFDNVTVSCLCFFFSSLPTTQHNTTLLRTPQLPPLFAC